MILARIRLPRTQRHADAATGERLGDVAAVVEPFVSFGTTHRTSTTASWPQPKDAAPTANIELRKILYQAQVNQAAAAKPQAVSGKRDWVWWVGAGAALALVVLLPQLWQGERS